MKIADTSAQDEKIAPNSTQRWSRRLGWLAICLSLLLAAGWLLWPAAQSWSGSQLAVPLARVRVDTVKVADFVRDISAQGQVVAAVSPKLYAPADGTVTLLLDAGTAVKKGQVLASIDSPELSSRLRQEQATFYSLQTAYERQQILVKKQLLADLKAVDIARMTLNTAEREKRRHQEAFAIRAVSALDFQKAHDELDTARVQFRHAEADAKLNKENLDFELKSLAQQLERQRLLMEDYQRQVDSLQVRSPVDGLLGNLAIDNKTYLAKNQLILSVVDLSNFEVEVFVPESYANDLSIGLAVELSVDGQSYDGRLVTISPEVLENQVKGRVRFSERAPATLRQNQRLSGRILLEQRAGVLQVARGQFLDSSNGRYVYRVQDGVAVKTPVATGARSINAVEILHGLKAGDQIITSGTDSFQGANQVQLN
jgi:HlyD family secretion protein